MAEGMSGSLQVAVLLFTAAMTWQVTHLLTGSNEIAIALATLGSSIPQILIRSRELRRRAEREALWPEVIESVISALHAGKTISEALIDLAQFGPEELSFLWRRVAKRIMAGQEIEEILSDEAEILESPRADQFFATLIFAKSYGGNSVQNSLRSLATFIRDDNQMFEEIETRFGWVKNSAALAAAAPWLLLLLLSAQPGTVEAFATSSGRTILSIGVVATVIAYLWMGKIAQLPKQSRVFYFGMSIHE
jgi:tight adherence protein B